MPPTLTDNEQIYFDERVSELLDLGESWDQTSAEAEVYREIEQERLSYLKHV